MPHLCLPPVLDPSQRVLLPLDLSCERSSITSMHMPQPVNPVSALAAHFILPNPSPKHRSSLFWTQLNTLVRGPIHLHHPSTFLLHKNSSVAYYQHSLQGKWNRLVTLVNHYFRSRANTSTSSISLLWCCWCKEGEVEHTGYEYLSIWITTI